MCIRDRQPKHNEAGVKVFDEQLKSLIMDKKLQKYIKTIIYYHMHLSLIHIF